MRNNAKTLMVVVATIVWTASAAQSQANANVSAQSSTANATFELVNHQAGVIAQGSSRLVAVSAWATHRTKMPLGKTEGLEVEFFTKPLTAANKAEIVERDGKELKKKDYASIVLLLGKDKNISQVNLSYVIPGTTVTRTVASTPDELAKAFSIFQFDGKRLWLKGTGSFSELNDKREALSLAWNVDIDIPVFEHTPK